MTITPSLQAVELITEYYQTWVLLFSFLAGTQNKKRKEKYEYENVMQVPTAKVI